MFHELTIDKTTVVEKGEAKKRNEPPIKPKT